jgi:hypothetical protein
MRRRMHNPRRSTKFTKGTKDTKDTKDTKLLHWLFSVPVVPFVAKVIESARELAPAVGECTARSPVAAVEVRRSASRHFPA